MVPVNQPVLVAMMQQVTLFKNILFQAGLSPSPPSMAVFWADLKQQHHDVSMPYMVQLAELGLMIPINTACCERGFSTYNIIKSKLRNQLKIMQIDSFMRIKALSEPSKEQDPMKPLRAFDTFDFDAASKSYLDFQARRAW